MFDCVIIKSKAKAGKRLNALGIPTKDIHLTEGKGSSDGFSIATQDDGYYIPNTLPDRQKITQSLLDLITEQQQLLADMVTEQGAFVTDVAGAVDKIASDTSAIGNEIINILTKVSKTPVPMNSPVLAAEPASLIPKVTQLTTDAQQQVTTVKNHKQKADDLQKNHKQKYDDLTKKINQIKEELV